MNGKGYKVYGFPTIKQDRWALVEQFIPENKNKFGEHIPGHYRKMREGLKRDQILDHCVRLIEAEKYMKENFPHLCRQE